jgi:hypothetical protein
VAGRHSGSGPSGERRPAPTTIDLRLTNASIWNTRQTELAKEVVPVPDS